MTANDRKSNGAADVDDGYRSFSEGGHVIFYVFGDNYLSIIGTPHKSMGIGPDLF